MLNLQDAMAGSQSDSILALLGRTIVDEAEKLHFAEKLHCNRVSVPTLLLLSDSELNGLIRDLFPAATLGAKLGFKAAIRFQKESVAPRVLGQIIASGTRPAYYNYEGKKPKLQKRKYIF